MSMPSRRTLPPLEKLQSALEYNGETGVLTWAAARNFNIIGSPAGALSSSGYIQIQFNGRRYAAHRIVWYLFYGFPPVDEIDHINGDRSDNRIANLRAANSSQNKANQVGRGKYPKGVSKQSKGYFVAQIQKDRKQIYLGNFKTPEEAAAAYQEAAKRIHGEFARW